MLPDTETLVIIADLDNPHRFGGILREPCQIETMAGLVLSNVLCGYGQMFLNHAVDTIFDLLNLGLGGRLR